MLISVLLRLRRSPKVVRDRYALLFAILVTLSVGVVWGITLPGRLDYQSEAVAADTSRVPFASLLEKVREQFATAFEAVSEPAVPGSSEVPYMGTADIILTPEQAAEGAAQAAAYAASTTAIEAQVVEIITTSQLASSSGSGSSLPMR